MKKLIILPLLLLVSIFSQAQDRFERLYRSDRINQAIDIQQTSDDGYMLLSAGRDQDSTEFDFYTITRFDNIE